MVQGARYRSTVIEVNLAAIEHNMKQIQDRLPEKVEVMAVVKANGYGHGALPVAERALTAGATRLGVAVLDEALELRAAGFTAPILVLGYTPVEGLTLARESNIACTMYTEEQVDQAIAAFVNKVDTSPNLPPLAIHLKLDTGMGRLGFTDVAAMLASAKKVTASQVLHLEGIFTHFAIADEESSFTQLQMERFSEFTTALQREQISVDLVHVDNTAGAILYPEWGYSFVRYGIALYGLYPSSYSELTRFVQLIPALTLKSAIVHIKDVPSATPISYAGTYVTPAAARIATLPIGYGDGYPRALSNCGEVLVRGQRARVVGRICMDQMMIDVTDIEGVTVGDEVVLIGKQGSGLITADELAERIGTINYELVTRLGERIPRIYLD